MSQAGPGKHQVEEHQEEAGQEHLHRRQEQLLDLLLLLPGAHFELSSHLLNCDYCLTLMILFKLFNLCNISALAPTTMPIISTTSSMLSELSCPYQQHVSCFDLNALRRIIIFASIHFIVFQSAAAAVRGCLDSLAASSATAATGFWNLSKQHFLWPILSAATAAASAIDTTSRKFWVRFKGFSRGGFWKLNFQILWHTLPPQLCVCHWFLKTSLLPLTHDWTHSRGMILISHVTDPTAYFSWCHVQIVLRYDSEELSLSLNDLAAFLNILRWKVTCYHQQLLLYI